MTLREKELVRQLAECRQALAHARRENELLRQKIDLLVRRVFGSSSERLDRAQLELLCNCQRLWTQEPAALTLSKNRKLPPVHSRKERAPRLPENLPVVEEVIDPEPVKAAPQSWRCIGQEVSEQLDFEPARFLRRRTIRRKYVHRADADSRPADRALARTVAGSQPACAGTAGAHFGGQILRPPAAVPAGTNFHAPSRSASAPADVGAVGGTGGGLVKAHLRTHPHRGYGRRLCAGGRNADQLSGTRPRTGTAGLSLDGQSSRVVMCFTAGKPAAPRRVWRRLFR